MQIKEVEQVNLRNHRRWIVYALTDDLGNIRYIGKTYCARRRMIAHLTEARRSKSKRHCLNWIRSLMSRGQRPQMIVIETFDSEGECFSGEKKWITHYRSCGNDLCNSTIGGEGPSGYVPTMETRLLWSMNRKGRKMPPFTEEHKRRLSEAMKGRSHPLTVTTRARIGDSNRGKIRSLEMRLRVAVGHSRYTADQDAEMVNDRQTLSIAKTARKWGVSLCCIQKAERRHKWRLELGIA